MPNWCNNNVTVSGPIESVDAFVEGARGVDGVLSLRSMVPPPANIETDNCSGKHDEGVVCWYEWNVSSWGTKWDVQFSDLLELHSNESNKSVCYTFDTAWSPALEAFAAYSAKFPEVQVNYEYEELGMAFGGEMIIEGGEVVYQNEYSLPEFDLS